jgi:acyl-CoA synthetase (AMP-forming)/AMP-acid ligase II
MTQLSELDGPILPDTTLTTNELWLQNVSDHHDILALVCTHQLSDLYGISSAPLYDEQGVSYLRWTYGNLECAIQRFANGLKSRGLQKGDPVMMFTANNAEYIIATWAIYRIGCVHVPINPATLSHTREARHMLQTVQKACPSGSLAIIAGNAELCLPIEKLTFGLKCMKILVAGQLDGWISFENLMQETAETGKTDSSEPLESSILFTSGTTSLPKGCFIQTSSFPFTSALGWSQGSQPILPGDKFAHVLPNNHLYSYMCLMSCFMNGATVVFPGPTFVPETLLQTIQKEQCSHVALVPTMVLA